MGDAAVDGRPHGIYTGRRIRGGSLVPFARCTCGAVLNGQEEIDEHRELARVTSV